MSEELKAENAEKHAGLLRTCLQEYFGINDAAFSDYVESHCDYREVFANETLIEQGAQADDLYFVLSGRLRAIKDLNSGNQLVLGEIGRGETVGELAIFTEEPRSATVIAVRNSVVARMSYETLQASLAQFPGMAITITKQIINRFRRSEAAETTVEAPVTIAVIGLGGTPLHPFVDRLIEARKTHSAHVDAVFTADVLGKFPSLDKPDIVQPRGDLSRWLAQRELQNDAVFFVADSDQVDWCKTAVHHADEILLVADADSGMGPEITELEQAIWQSDDAAPQARRTLVLLHPKPKKTPSGTAKWLNTRNVDRHFHIRPNLDKDYQRLGRILAGRAIGLVLSGGGARGLAHIGITKALHERGIEVDYVGGTSAGAIMSTWIATDILGDEMVKSARYVFRESPVGNITGDYNPVPIISLLKGRRAYWITKTVSDGMTAGDIDLEDTWKTFFTVTSNYSKRQEMVLTRGNFVEAVMASFAIPGLFPPRLMNGDVLYDGGSFNNFPVDVMRKLGASRVIGVDLMSDYAASYDLEQPPGHWALFFDRFRSRKKRRYKLPTLPATLLTATFITAMNRQRGMRDRVDLLFQPRIRGVSMLDWKKFDKMVSENYALAVEQLDAMSDEAINAWRV
ncbi:MAG: patatin-like phospholipase family protein [Pseudomonadota bacterium]